MHRVAFTVAPAPQNRELRLTALSRVSAPCLLQGGAVRARPFLRCWALAMSSGCEHACAGFVSPPLGAPRWTRGAGGGAGLPSACAAMSRAAPGPSELPRGPGPRQLRQQEADLLLSRPQDPRSSLGGWVQPALEASWGRGRAAMTLGRSRAPACPRRCPSGHAGPPWLRGM